MPIPTYGGSAIFGPAAQIVMAVQPNAVELITYFGVDGVQQLDGGTRGRTLTVTGVLVDATPAAIIADGQLFESFADGVSRTLVDSTGTAWPNVVFRNEFQWTGPFMPTVGGWCRQYSATFHGLT